MKNGTLFSLCSSHFNTVETRTENGEKMCRIVLLMKAIDLVAEKRREQNETTVLKTETGPMIPFILSVLFTHESHLYEI